MPATRSALLTMDRETLELGNRHDPDVPSHRHANLQVTTLNLTKTNSVKDLHERIQGLSHAGQARDLIGRTHLDGDQCARRSAGRGPGQATSLLCAIGGTLRERITT
jgi:hypothetical protein